MIKTEFHCHTCYSKDSLVKIKDLLTVGQKKGLDRIVVTDHNEIAGAIKAYSLDPVRFIVGEEIMTLEGELIGIFMKELIPPGFSAMMTIELLRQQEAFITVAHPFDSFRKGSWELEHLLKITPYIDAIETFNSRCMYPQFNGKAMQFAKQNHLLATVGSDAHSTSELGTATLTLPDFHDRMTLKQALAEAKNNNRLSAPWVHFYSRYASWRKRRGAQCS